jgi:hypothetical protein
MSIKQRYGVSKQVGDNTLNHGVAPQIEVSGVFGVTSFEFG